MTKTNKKLSLSRETLRTLDHASLQAVQGGAKISRRQTNCLRCGTVGSVDVCPSLDAPCPTDPTIVD